MSMQAIRSAIETRFAQNFTALPVQYQNVTFRATAGQPFAELQVFPVKSELTCLGLATPLYRTHGLIRVNIYTAKGVGPAQATGYADLAAGVFKNAEFSGIVCRAPAVQTVGDQDGWWVVSVLVEFHADHS